MIARLPASPIGRLDWIGNASLGSGVICARPSRQQTTTSGCDDVDCHDGRGHAYSVVENAKNLEGIFEIGTPGV